MHQGASGWFRVHPVVGSVVASCCNVLLLLVVMEVVVIGGGSAAFAVAGKLAAAGISVKVVNAGLPIGGCCVNVGCVPSKTLLRAGETVFRGRAGGGRFCGVSTTGEVEDFGAVFSQASDLVTSLRRAKYEDVAAGLDSLTLVHGKGKFLSPTQVEVGGEVLNADKVVIATGTRTFVPDVPGLADSAFLTHEALFELRVKPSSLIIIGGRYIALELAQLMSRLGVHVTVLQRSETVIPTEAKDVAAEITAALEEEGIVVHTGVRLLAVERDQVGTVVVRASVDAEELTFTAAELLLATGRAPNTNGLNLTGLELDKDGFIVVNEYLETTVPGVYAAGDVIGQNQFVYAAAYEGGVVAKNILAKSPCCREPVDYGPLPWVIFTDPQVAGVGLDESMAAAQCVDVDVSVCPLSAVPRSIAARNIQGMIKLFRRSEDERLVGARVVGTEASELLMTVAVAIKNGMTSSELAGMLFPYLTLSEGLKLACLGFDTDVSKLSCCAS